jgi:hypothetical protein
MDNKSQSLVDVTKLLPEKVKEWQAVNEAEFYDGQTIYDYMNGAGEVYKQYDFKQLYSRRFERAENPAITLEIFDMTTSIDAYGIFSHTRSGEAIIVGQGGADMGPAIGFWKERFFVYISTEKETSHSKEAMLSFAHTVANAIQETGSKPGILDLLPKENLVENEIHYSRSFVLSNTRYFIATENILDIDSKTEVLIALYRNQDTTFKLMLIQYPEEIRASRAEKNFIKFYRPELSDSTVFAIEDGTWCGVERNINYLIFIFESESRSQTQQMLKHIVIKIQHSGSDTK